VRFQEINQSVRFQEINQSVYCKFFPFFNKHCQFMRFQEMNQSRHQEASPRHHHATG
jgi:hypothetical protein